MPPATSRSTSSPTPSSAAWWRAAAALFVPLALFAAADELTQPLFGRSADGVDWAFDELGLVAGIGLVTVATRLLAPFLARSVNRPREA